MMYYIVYIFQMVWHALTFTTNIADIEDVGRPRRKFHPHRCIHSIRHQRGDDSASFGFYGPLAKTTPDDGWERFDGHMAIHRGRFNGKLWPFRTRWIKWRLQRDLEGRQFRSEQGYHRLQLFIHRHVCLYLGVSFWQRQTLDLTLTSSARQACWMVSITFSNGTPLTEIADTW